MPQPLKLDRPVDLHIVLPTTLYGEVTMQLYSDAHGRIPQGKLSGTIAEALRMWLEIRKGKLTIMETR